MCKAMEEGAGAPASREEPRSSATWLSVEGRPLTGCVARDSTEGRWSMEARTSQEVRLLMGCAASDSYDGRCSPCSTSKTASQSNASAEDHLL